MWTRAELKERAKAAFMKNYWVCVAAAFILSLLVGGSSGGSSSGSSIDLSEDGSIMSMFEDDSDDIFDDDTYGIYTILCFSNKEKTKIMCVFERILLLHGSKNIILQKIFNFFKKIHINLHKTFDFFNNIVYNNNCNKNLLKE